MAAPAACATPTCSRLLSSALARPRQLYAHGDARGQGELAAASMVGIVRNHPFLDGNQRTGFVVGVLFLEMNGARFTASEEAAAQAILDVASGALDEAALARFLDANARTRRRP
ncbi:MAG TPA: type II toxin-antitoxin system death-on-curing family toxin [Terriglobales bacterium]|nr:type II toxin-antitoxin system death-on-curing family toxin [Terriglobales bacterium]